MVLGESKKKWLHSANALLCNRVSYTVRFLGKVEVTDQKGIEVVRAALHKLTFKKQIKQSEGVKPAKVILNININYISLLENKTKMLLHNVPLQNISFCSDDKKDKHLFSFIAKIDSKHFCFGFESTNEANNITLTIGQAFDVAYEEYMKVKKVEDTKLDNKQMVELNKKVSELALENSKLKQRIAQLEQDKRNEEKIDLIGDFNATIPSTERSQESAKDNFDMKPFSTTCDSPCVKLPSHESVHPFTRRQGSRRSQRGSFTSQKTDTQANSETMSLESSDLYFENKEIPQSTLPPSLLVFDPLYN